MRGKILLPIIGLAVIVIAVCAVWYTGLDRTTVPDPPIPEDMSRTEPAIVDLIHRARNAVFQDKTDPAGWMTLGMIYEANSNNGFARICYEQAVELDGLCARCWYHTAQMRFATSEHGPAIVAMRKSSQLQSDYAPTHYRLGFWILDQGDLLGAEASFTRATQLAPRDPAGWFGMAMVRMRQERNEEARQLLEGVLQWTPLNRHYGNQLLGTVYRRLGRLEDAERVLQSSGGPEIIWPDPWSREISQFHYGAGRKIEGPMQLLAQGQVARAVQLLEDSLRETPEDSVLLSSLAVAYRSAGQLDRSIETIKKAIAIRTHYHQAHFNLGLAYLMKAEQETDPVRMAEYERLAMEAAVFSLDVNPSYPQAHGLKGRLLERKGEHDEALEEYHIAIKDVISGQYWLMLQCDLLTRLNRWEDAIDSFELLLTRYVPQPEAQYSLTMTQIQAERLQDAMASAERFAQFWPHDQRVMELRRALQNAQQSSGPGPRPGGGGS